MHNPGTPVMRAETSAANAAEPSWAVSTKSMPPTRIASISGSTLPLGTPKPRAIPAALSVATIRSALFICGCYLGCMDTGAHGNVPVSYTHLRAHETPEHLVCRLL